MILSRLVHVFELGESPHSREVCGVDGEYGSAASRRFAIDLFLPSLAVFEGVEGAPAGGTIVFTGTAVGRALKKRCENLGISSTFTTTAAAPAV